MLCSPTLHGFGFGLICRDLKNTVLKPLCRIPALSFGDICDRHQRQHYSLRQSRWQHSLIHSRWQHSLINYRWQHSPTQIKMPLMFERLPETVIQSQNDPNDYRVLRLENGLTALLIADKEDESSTSTKPAGSGDEEKTGEKLAAAALCVGVGSFSDPPDIPGQAHFLEHMVFMGSEKYPNENEFDEFVKKHGGYNNAFTETEYTVFYFNIEKSVLEKGLDIFSGFFTRPLMKQDSVDREIKAVDSEFCMSKPSDSVRYEQILGSLAKDGHPMGKFMWGNLESLKETPMKQGIDTYSRLQEFHKIAYSAHYMTLVVQAMYPLDTLEDWVVEIFSPVPNNAQPRPSFHHLKDPFDTEKFNKIYKVIPCKNETKVVIAWSLPSLLQHYQSKPLNYIEFLVGHEGKGSIMSYLRKRMWAEDLVAGNSEVGFELNETQSSFSVSIQLTDAGFENVYEVITIVLQYIEMLRREGPKRWIYDEIKNIQDNDFRWIEADDPVDNVEKLCSNMLRYPVTEYISGPKLYKKYDPETISRCIELLVPHRANIYLSSKKFKKEYICHLKEQWYKTEYCVQDIPEDLQSKWQDVGVDSALHLPEPNHFIASDFTMKSVENPTEFPVLITDTDQGRLYYKQDTKFKTPKAYVSFLLLSHAVKRSPESLVMFDLFVDILNYQMTETAYAASVASLSYLFRRQDHGLQLKVVGFNHKLLKLFETMVDFIADFSVDEALLATMKTKSQKDYYNFSLKPSKHNHELRLSILRRNEPTCIDGMRIIPTITVDMVMAFVKEMTSEVFVDGLIQGNLNPQEAQMFESYLLKKFNCRAIPGKVMPEDRVLELGTGEIYSRVDNLNKNDENSVITNYYQHGPANRHQYSLNDLLIMRMEEPCFDVLRTRHQLGYNVSCVNRVTDGILGISLSVCSQAHKFTLEQLDVYMEDFLTEFDSMLQSDSEEDFNTVRSSLITLKKCIDSNLGEEFSRNWGEITDRTYCFDTLRKQVAELEKITLSELRDWYRAYLPSGGKSRKLSVQVEGHKSAAKSGDEDMEEGKDVPEEEETHMEEEEEEEDDDDDEEEENDEIIDEKYSVTELILKPIEGKPSNSVITDIGDLQQKSTFYPVSRIL